MALTDGEYGMEKKTGRKNPGNAKIPRYYPLGGEQAIQMLALLADKDDSPAEEIAKISAQIYCNISVEKTVSSVYRSLDGIAIEDCWDASGRQRGGGYRDEFDVAYDMISEVFSPYLHQIEEYHRLVNTLRN